MRTLHIGKGDAAAGFDDDDDAEGARPSGASTAKKSRPTPSGIYTDLMAEARACVRRDAV